MIKGQPRPSRLSGLWACVVGAPLLAVLLLFLDPVTRQEDCPNFGASGNASAFSNPMWDLYLPLVLLGWLVLVIMEQALPVTWRHRSRLNGAVRAITAILLSISSCCLVLPLEIMCN